MAGGSVLDRLSALADRTRARLLLVLEQHELTVNELCQVTQLPQSTVSRHLKTLADGGWIASRRDGTSRFYAMALDRMAPQPRRLWDAVRDQLGEAAAPAPDRRRLRAVLAARRTRSEAFFSASAREWDRVRDELFGSMFHLRALAGLIDETWTVGDLGCGTGLVAEALAPFVARIIGVDGAEAMLDAARERLRGHPNVELRQGALEALPIERGALDAAHAVLVLHHVGDPGRVVREMARVLRPGGRALVVDMLPHDREEYRRNMGHVWLGFSGDQISKYLAEAGFADARTTALPSVPSAQGPPLFVATARREQGA